MANFDYELTEEDLIANASPMNYQLTMSDLTGEDPTPQPTPQQTGPKQFDLGAVYQQYEPQIKETASGILKGITDVGEVAERIVMPWTHFTGTESSRLQEQEGLNQYKPQHEFDVLGFKTNLFDVGKMGGEAVATGGMGGVAGGARGAAVLPKMVLGGIEGATGNALIEAEEQFRERNFDPGQLAASLGIGALAGAGFGAAAHGVGTAFNKMFPKKEVATLQENIQAAMREKPQIQGQERSPLDFGYNTPDEFAEYSGKSLDGVDLDAVGAEDSELAALISQLDGQGDQGNKRLKTLFDMERADRKAGEAQAKAQSKELDKLIKRAVKEEDQHWKSLFEAERANRKAGEIEQSTEARDRLKQVNEMLQRYRNQKKDKAANAKTLDKFLKHVNKVEDFNKKTSIKVKLAPDIDPVSDFLSRERQVTKTKHQTFAVEAESDISLRGRIDKAIEDGDTKAADVINEEIAKRKQNPEAHTAQEDIIPEEALQQTQQEIDAAIQVKSIDDARGYERGAIGMPIEEALEGGVINEAAAATARAFAEVQLQLKAARATVKAAGDELLKRYPDQDVFELHGMKFSRYEKDARVHLEYQDEFDDAIKDIPQGSVVRDVAENVRGTVDADPKKLVVPMEAMSDDQIVQAAGIAKAQITPLDKERKQLAQALIPHLKENRAVLKQDFENASISMEYVSPHQQHYYDTTPEQQEAAAQIQLKLKEFLEADKAYKKKDIKAAGKISKAFTNKKLALTAGLSAIQQFMHGQAAEAADATTKAVTAPGMLEAMSQPISEVGIAAAVAQVAAVGSKKLLHTLLNKEEGKLAIAASIAWKDTQDRLEMLGRIVGDSTLASERVRITAMMNKLYFGKEMGDPEIAAKALFDLRSGVVSAADAMAGKGEFTKLTPDQRKAVLLARAHQAQLSKVTRDFKAKLVEWKKAAELNPEMAKKLGMVNHLESSLRFHESRVGAGDRRHMADVVTNGIMNLFGEFHFGTKNMKFNLMNILTDAPILGASTAGWRSYSKAIKDLKVDRELAAMFKHSNLAGQRQQDIIQTASEGADALYNARRTVKKVTDKVVPGFDSEKINADHFALAKAYDYFKQNQDAIKQSGFRGDAKEFAKALFSGKESLSASVSTDAWMDISLGLSRAHGVDPFGLNTNYLNEGALSRLAFFFTKQPARTARLMAHYVANGEWKKYNQMLAALALAGGSAAIPAELMFLGNQMAPEKMEQMRDAIDNLEIYRLANPHRTMTPKSTYALFMWPLMGSVSPVFDEISGLQGESNSSIAGDLFSLVDKFAETGRIEGEKVQKLSEKSAMLVPVPGMNYAADYSKAMRENKDGIKAWGHDRFGRFKPTQKQKFSLEQLQRTEAENTFARLFTPGVDIAQYNFDKQNDAKRKLFWQK